jgi:hypothetical protein
MSLMAQQDTTQTVEAKNEVRNVDDFHVVKIYGNVHAELVKGDKPSVKLVQWGAEADISKVSTTVKSGELKIENLGAGEKKEIRAIVTYVEVDELIADAGGNIAKTDLIEAKFLKIHISKGSMAHINIKTDNLTASVTNGAEVWFKGTAKSSDIKVNNGSKMHAFDLVAQEMMISASAGAFAEVQAVERLEAKSTLKSQIIYLGYPAKYMPKMSAGGTISKKE